MALETILDDILDARSKVRVVRLFALRTDDFLASGREVARLTALSPPTAHAALRSLLDARVLGREIVGRQHLYRLNSRIRLVRDLLRPLFVRENALREDVGAFLETQISGTSLRDLVVSAVLYGSLAAGKTRESSDCDVAVVARDARSKARIEKAFCETISGEFFREFGFHVDPYVKTEAEFRRKLRRNEPPVTTLMKGYRRLFGKDPIELLRGTL
jgi:predicted nucleotidyltransferase